MYRKECTAEFFPFSALETFGRAELRKADVVIAGVLTPGGAAAPIVLAQKHFRRMKHGCYIADVAIDQGGSTAWSKVTKPGETFARGKNELVFSCVPNIPGSTVPREATEALTKATISHVCVLGLHVMEHNRRSGLYWALKGYPDLRAGLQTFSGSLVNSLVCAKHQLEQAYKPMESFF
jgi:alanine dehydrogenase